MVPNEPTALVRGTPARGLKFQQLAAQLRQNILADEWPPGSKLPTEVQLAKDTGLSLTTIRRAFDELVEQGLVERRQGAGSFVCHRQSPTRVRHRVGVLVPTTQLYYPKLLQGIEEALSQAGASMQLATYHYDAAEERNDLQFLLDSGVDGLILAPTLEDPQTGRQRLEELVELPIPTVFVERRLLDAGVGDRSVHVCSDHAGGAYDAIRHLHDLGHRNIALLARTQNPTVPPVIIGYREACKTLGLPTLEPILASEADWTEELAAEMIVRLRADSVTAILAAGDRQATLLARAALRQGLTIPGDLAVISYDDETADLAEVPLTAVAPPKYRVGRLAAEVLLRRLSEGNAFPQHKILLRPRIVIRDSCGARGIFPPEPEQAADRPR